MDDLLDLSWSDKPASGAGTRPSGAGAGAGAFDLLSKPSNPGAPNYSGRSTPLVPSPRPASAAGSAARMGGASNGITTPAGPGTGRHTPLSAGAAAPKPAIGGDAFSDLLGGSGGPGGASSGKNLSMAERAAKLAAEKAEKERRDKEQWGGFLDGFEAPKPGPAAKPASPAPPQPMLAPKPQPAVARAASPMSERPSPAPSSTASVTKPGSFWDSEVAKSATPANNDSDDLDDFLGGSSKPAQVKPSGGDLLGGASGGSSAPSGPSDPWDFDALAASVPAPSDKPKERSNDRPSDFDYGNDFAEDDDDLLGGLGSAPAVSC